MISSSPARRRSPPGPRPRPPGCARPRRGRGSPRRTTGVGRERAAHEGPARGGSDAAHQRHHDVAPPADGAGHGVAPGEALAEHGDVRHDAEIGLCAAHADAEARDDLVEDQQRAELVAQRAHLPVVVREDGPRAALGAQGFEQDRRRSAAQAVELQLAPQGVEVVRRTFLRGAGGAARDARGLHAAGVGQAHAIGRAWSLQPW